MSIKINEKEFAIILEALEEAYATRYLVNKFQGQSLENYKYENLLGKFYEFINKDFTTVNIHLPENIIETGKLKRNFKMQLI